MSDRMQDNTTLSEEERRTILIVEDDNDLGEILALGLPTELDYRILRVHHAYEALHVVKTLTPVLFLIDYQLPSMTGLQLYDQLQRSPRLANIPTILMSANLPIQEVAKRKIVGIEKPFDLDQLLHLIEQLLLKQI